MKSKPDFATDLKSNFDRDSKRYEIGLLREFRSRLTMKYTMGK